MMENENKKQETTNEKDSLDSFLNHSSLDYEKKNNKKPKKKLLILLFAVIALVIIAGVILLLTLCVPQKEIESTHEDASITLKVDKEKIHQADVAKDENNNIKQNGHGSLIKVDTNTLSTIKVNNQSGSYTIISNTPTRKENGKETTEKTIYKIKEYPDMKIKDGSVDAVATAVSNLSFSTVVSVNANLSDFGLDKPRATVTSAFKDKSLSKITVGNDAPQDAGTYILFGSEKTVYLIDKETASNFLYSVLDFASLEISKSGDSNSSTCQRLTLSGSKFPDEISLSQNKDKEIDASYNIISPLKSFANEEESTSISGALRGLTATKAVCINPDENDISKYGLSSPYVKANALFSDITYTYLTSKPKKDNVYIMLDNGNMIYEIALSSVPWAETDLTKLKGKYVLPVNKEYISNISCKISSGTYSVDVSTTEKDDEKITVASFQGNKLNSESFNVFMQNFNLMEIVGEPSETDSSPTTVITVKYNTERDDDVIKIYNTGATKIPVTLNDEPVGSIYKSYITTFDKNIVNLVNGNTILNI